MKNILGFLLILFGILYSDSLSAQKIKKSTVPSSVQQSFLKKFPGILKVKWEKENNKYYEAEFKDSGIEKSAIFDESGTFIELESEITMNQLPDVVIKSLHKSYPGFELEEPEMIQRADGIVFYEVEAEKGKKSFELLLDSKGEVIKETLEEE